MTFDSLGYERSKFKERTKGISEDDVQWLINRFVKEYPKLSDYTNDPRMEEQLLERINLAIYGVEKDKPRDIRIYVEGILKEQNYDKRLEDLSNEIFSIRLGDIKACGNLERKIHKLLAEAERDFPGFTKARALMISEISGDILAVKSHGLMGSTRMCLAIKRNWQRRLQLKN